MESLLLSHTGIYLQQFRLFSLLTWRAVDHPPLVYSGKTGTHQCPKEGSHTLRLKAGGRNVTPSSYSTLQVTVIKNGCVALKISPWKLCGWCADLLWLSHKLPVSFPIWSLTWQLSSQRKMCHFYHLSSCVGCTPKELTTQQSCYWGLILEKMSAVPSVRAPSLNLERKVSLIATFWWQGGELLKDIKYMKSNPGWR
jgi:hypothetical protein